MTRRLVSLCALVLAVSCNRSNDAPVADGRSEPAASAHTIPRDPFQPRSQPAPNAMMDSTPMSLVVEVRAHGTSHFVLTRASVDGSEQLVLSTPDGRIPTFTSNDSALAFAKRVIPPPLDSLEAEVAAALGAEMAPSSRAYDLDSAYRWATAPSTTGPSPSVIVDAWSVVEMGGDLAMLPHPDPMAMAFPQGEGRNTPLEPDAALGRSAMILHGIVRGAERRAGKMGPEVVVAWPDATYWTPDDGKRIADVLRPALRAFASRLTPVSAEIEQALREVVRP